MTTITDHELLDRPARNLERDDASGMEATPSVCSKPIRVLYVDHTAMLGGGEIALLNLVRHLDRGQVTPIVLLFTEGPLADKLRLVCEVLVRSLPPSIATTKKDTLGLGTLLRVRDIAAAVIYTVRLAKFIKRSCIDLVHTNSLKADIIAGIAGRLADRPVVWHVRDRIDSDYLPAPVVTLFRLLCRLIPQFVIANSCATLATLHLASKRPSTSIPSGIDLSQRTAVVHDGLDPAANVAEKSIKQRTPIIGLIGRICEWKGQHVFLDAAARVRQQFPSTHFRIIGAPLFGEQTYEARLHRQCSSLGLDDVVEFSGFRSDIPAVIADLEIVVHASITGEPFGQVIIEGMAAAKPVVATNGGGVPEIVVHDETGLLVPMGDAIAMADAICALLTNPHKAQEMGARGFERVQKYFTIQKTARAVESVYHGLLQRKRSRRQAACTD
jgi:glycosyltransferase involved in cell wall biosynthesis